MKCITIQNKYILLSLLNDGKYISIYKLNEIYMRESYKFMKDIYKYKGVPIFLAPIGYKVEFYGAKFDKDSVAIELNIPNSYIKVQKYYDWTDFIYTIENDKDDVKNTIYKNIDEYGYHVLNDNSIENMNLNNTYQITVGYLKKEWIISFINVNATKLENCHNGVGGQYILKDLNYYIDYTSKDITKYILI